MAARQRRPDAWGVASFRRKDAGKAWAPALARRPAARVSWFALLRRTAVGKPHRVGSRQSRQLEARSGAAHHLAHRREMRVRHGRELLRQK